MKHTLSSRGLALVRRAAPLFFAAVFAAFLLIETAYGITAAPPPAVKTYLSDIVPHSAKAGFGCNVQTHLTTSVKQASGKTVSVGVAGEIINYRFIDGDGDVTLVSAVTDSNGYANIVYVPEAPGLDSFDFYFLGDTTAHPASASGTFDVSE